MELSRRMVLAAGLAGVVALKPENPVVGGTVLRRQAIQSPNFVTGVSGWTINQDGSAEFNNVTVRGTVIAGHFIGSGEGQEVLIYSGPPAAGNLLASICSATGTDSHGNAFLAGVTTYSTAAPFFASQLLAGGIVFYQAASQAGPWSAGAVIDLDTGNNLIVNPNGTLSVPAPAQFTRGPVAIQGAGGGNVLTATETAGAPASPPSQFIAHGAAERVLGVQVTGDAANFRLRLDSNGRLDWGPGNAATDVALLRAAVGVLADNGALVVGAAARSSAADLEVQSIVGLAAHATPAAPPALFGYLYLSSADSMLHFKNPTIDQAIAGDPWNSLGALGAHYTVNLGRYRFAANRTLELDINVTGDGLQAGTVSFANTLPLAYRPASDHTTLPLGSTRAVTATDVWPRIAVTAAGAVSVTVTPVAGIVYAASLRIPLD